MAFLVLPGELEQHDRLVAAHWIVNHSRPRDGRPGEIDEVYARLRDRVLRAAMRPQGRAGVRLGPWLRARPAAASERDAALAGALARLTPQARAAYVLRHLEELPGTSVRGRLEALGVADPDAALRDAALLDLEIPPLTPDELPGRPALDPTIASLYGRRRRFARPRRPVFVAGAVAVVLAAGGTVLLDGGLGSARTSGPAARRPDRVTRTGPGEWHRTTRLDLDAWPARGDLANDAGLVAEALAAWNGTGGTGGTGVSREARGGADAGPPDRDPQLLYAGTIGSSRVALLHDAQRVARYTAAPGGRRIEIFPEGRLLPGGAGPLKVAPARYLVPPWVTGFRAAALGAERARWRRVPLTDGLTGEVAAAARGGCWRGPVFELRQPEIAHGRPYTMADLGDLQSANLLFQPPPPAPVRRLGPHQIDSAPEAAPAGFALWGRLGCTPAAPAGHAAPAGPASRSAGGRGDVESATAWEFWSGALPDRGGPGRWVCTRYAFGDGGSATYALLLDTRGAVLAGRHADTWDCSRLQRDIAAGAWWRSPNGRWHYLAAASRRVAALTARGPFARPAVRGGLLIARGPAGDRPPAGRVTLLARNDHRRAMPLFQEAPR
ncbi:MULTISPECIES: hypothetical protein [Thermomonosporaceae]|uniref:hypothetical protein n=1 Tax=Thermomonosporaceae TaxID=2012 RepID=UPI00255A78D9|nr:MULTISPECIES: hypothetical protein [Thermomonosporaceae]MDL4774635.1 hypothetical protein [Actinomadura xylanilytica]